MGDPNRHRLYRAESILPRGREFENVREIQEYCNELVVQPWFRARWDRTYVEVRDGRRRSSAGGSPLGYITMPRWSRYERIVLHEVAHVLSPMGEWHGNYYARIFVTLVEGVWGRHQAMLFEGSLIGKGVRPTIEMDPRVRVAAHDRAKPLVLSVGLETLHTHAERLDIYHPVWQKVDKRTGICKHC